MIEAPDMGASIEDRVVERARQDVAARWTNARATPSPRDERGSGRKSWLVIHWLAAVNLTNGLIVGGTFLAPWLRASGYDWAAVAVYGFYRIQCPQRPSHSFYIFGNKMGMEQRMVAIYAGWFVTGLVFALLRQHLRPISLAVLIAASLPMAIDVGSQMAGLRGGSWQARLVTGALFAIATVWWALPRAEAGMNANTSTRRMPRGAGGMHDAH